MSPASATLDIPPEAFTFSGQTRLDTWTLTDFYEEHGKSPYHSYLTQEVELCFEAIRDLADAFPTYQRQPPGGGHELDERTHIIALLLKQFLDLTYAGLESVLRILQDYFDIPDRELGSESTYSRKNRSQRWTRLLERLHTFLMDRLPDREVVIATDATGYSGRKRSWSETGFAARATQNWEKAHAAIEVPTLLYLNIEVTDSGVHESQVFDDVWADLPDNTDPVRSLADAAYSGNENLETVREQGATPIHDLRQDHRYERFPDSAYGKLVNFATHWPNRYDDLRARRGLAESAFQRTKETGGERLRCRDPRGRRNEVRAKKLVHNVRVLVMRSYMVRHRD